MKAIYNKFATDLAQNFWKNCDNMCKFITSRCFEIQTIDKLWLLFGFVYMDLRLINRNLIIEKHGYTIEMLLNMHREISPRKLGPWPHNDRGDISRYLVNNL